MVPPARDCNAVIPIERIAYSPHSYCPQGLAENHGHSCKVMVSCLIAIPTAGIVIFHLSVDGSGKLLCLRIFGIHTDPPIWIQNKFEPFPGDLLLESCGTYSGISRYHTFQFSPGQFEKFESKFYMKIHQEHLEPGADWNYRQSSESFNCHYMYHLQKHGPK